MQMCRIRYYRSPSNSFKFEGCGQAMSAQNSEKTRSPGNLTISNDFFCGLQEKEDAHLSEWDRFARTEYVRLAMEEEGEEERNDGARGAGGWESSLEAPF